MTFTKNMDTKYQVLVVEDDRNIAELLEIHLKDLDCEVFWVSDGQEGQAKAIENHYDLIILDVMLPGKDGMDIARNVRAANIHSPILMLTSKSEEIDKVLGLEAGADDYMTKPFSVREFIARVRAIFRRQALDARAETAESEMLTFNDLEVDIPKRKVVKSGQRIDLTPKEFELIALLAGNPGVTYSRERILSLIWGYEFEGYEHTVNSHINRLRAKIEEDMSNPQFILTSWGVGYRFNDEL